MKEFLSWVVLILVGLTLFLLMKKDQDEPIPQVSVERPTFDHLNPVPCEALGYSQKYDRLIYEAWKRHAPIELLHRHCNFRAQIAAESSMNPNAVSSAGATGLGQIMETTAKDCYSAGLFGDRVNPRFSLSCSAWIMERNRRVWIATRPVDCRHNLALAGYISGSGSIVKAQTIATEQGRSARCLDDGIADHLDEAISPENAEAVLTYVERINDMERRMLP